MSTSSTSISYYVADFVHYMFPDPSSCQILIQHFVQEHDTVSVRFSVVCHAPNVMAFPPLHFDAGHPSIRSTAPFLSSQRRDCHANSSIAASTSMLEIDCSDVSARCDCVCRCHPRAKSEPRSLVLRRDARSLNPSGLFKLYHVGSASCCVAVNAGSIQVFLSHSTLSSH